MIYIAHRGNLNGPSAFENKPEYVRQALDLGYDAEIDVWLQEGGYWLGHDSPQYEVPIQFLADNRLWCHAKTPETFADLCIHRDINSFFQASDAVATTSWGYLWCHSNSPMVHPRAVWNTHGNFSRDVLFDAAYAICSDWPLAPAPKKTPIKLILLDVDGVMTDGLKTYDVQGRVISKVFYDKDFTAIKRFQAAGVKVVGLTSDTFNVGIFGRRGIPCYWVQAGKEKKFELAGIAAAEQVSLHEIAVVGDDYYDLLLLENVNHSYCPQDAISDVRKAVGMVLPDNGGQGVVVALWEALRESLPNVYPLDNPQVNP